VYLNGFRAAHWSVSYLKRGIMADFVEDDWLDGADVQGGGGGGGKGSKKSSSTKGKKSGKKGGKKGSKASAPDISVAHQQGQDHDKDQQEASYVDDNDYDDPQLSVSARPAEDPNETIVEQEYLHSLVADQEIPDSDRDYWKVKSYRLPHYPTTPGQPPP
jgi:hypothetical protein